MQKETPDKMSSAVQQMAEHWPMIDALVGGTSAMRRAGTQFLPKWPSEPADSYAARLATSTLFPAFSHTCNVMAAKPFARPIKIGNLPEAISGYLSDVDMQGTEIQPFAAQLALACMQYGLIGVLVEFPRAEGMRTRADEKRAGVRPYLTKYPAASILGWRSQRVGETYELTQLRLKERVSEPSGKWGETEVEQVRVLEPGRWEIWRKAEDKRSEWFLHDEGVTSLRRIPFAFFYGLRKDFGVGVSPLLDVAHLNVEHWQSSSDQRTILHVARVPILFAKGFTEADQLVVGASSAVRSNSAEADLKYVEHSGAAIESGRNDLLDLEDRMRQAGAELLVQRPSITTATQVESENEGGRSILQKIAEDIEASLERCLRLMGEWIGVAADPDVEIYKDFGSADLADKGGDLLLRAREGAIVSRETAFRELQRKDIISLELDWADESARIEEERRADHARDLEKQRMALAVQP